MIAYFGILSIIPAAFLFISALAIAGALGSQGWIVEQLQYLIPGQGANTIVKTVENLRANSGSLGLVGAFGVFWGSTNFFSCIESALNIIHGVNNRHVLIQKAWIVVLMFAALVAMTVATVVVAVLLPFVQQLDELTQARLNFPISDGTVSAVISFVFATIFFMSCYRFLPNTPIRTSQVWRGALIAAVAFEVSIHLLPAYIAQNRGGAVITAFAGAFIVLIWFYLMAFVLLVGGVYNWWWVEKRRRAAAAAQIAETTV